MPVDVPPERRPASPKTLARQTRGAAETKAPFVADPVALTRNAVLLFVLVAAAFSVRMHVAPQFGRTFGSMWFYFGVFLSVVSCTTLVGGDARSQRRALLTAALLQGVSALGGRAVAAFAAANMGNPVAAAAIAHALVSYPMLGCAGAVWLEWAVCLLSELSDLCMPLICRVCRSNTRTLKQLGGDSRYFEYFRVSRSSLSSSSSTPSFGRRH